MAQASILFRLVLTGAGLLILFDSVQAQTLNEMVHLPQSPAEATSPVNDDDVRSAVDRSLVFLAKEGAAWISDRGCMSCHHVPFLVWSHRSAKEHGLKVDDERLREWEKWCQHDSLAHRNQYRLQSYDLGKLDQATLPDAVREKLKPTIEVPFATEAGFIEKLRSLLSADELKAHQDTLLKTAIRSQNHPDRTGGGLDVLASLLIGNEESSTLLTTGDFLSSTAGVMRGNQRPDGSWMSGQQHLTMRRWTEDAANQVTTMWAALALHQHKKSLSAEAQRKAHEFLKRQPGYEANREWLATRLLFEHQFGTREEVVRLSESLEKSRNTDGGWAWEAGGTSDPLTTGLAVYALVKTGSDRPEILRAARAWLLSHQAEDGSWPTAAKNFTKTTDPERLAARDEIYHYWGTAWAAIGLLETLGEVKDQPGGAS